MLLELKNIQKTYSTKNGVTFRALNNVSLTFESSGLVYIVGASGSGKSTLLNVIGGLDSYDSGEYVLAGKRMNALRGSEVDSLRNKLMGFVFQEFNLIDTLSVFENVKLALDMQSRKDNKAVHEALAAMGIDDKAKNKTKDLSGGQRQRVSIARALVKDPRIILADEPTGALDSATTDEVVKILKDLSKDRLVIVVTHDMDMAAKTGDRIIEMKDGCVYRDVRRKAEGESVVTTDTQLFSDTLMSVPAGVKVSDSDVEEINEIMAQSMRKTYINVESDPRKVKAMFPNLREAVNSDGKKPKAGEDEALSSEAFVPHKRVDSPMESVEFKKSRLPLLKSIRLALNNLNFKKARLALTIIISFIAFILFGVAQSFTSFDVRAAYTATLVREDFKSMAVTTAGSEFSSAKKRIASSDFIKLSETVEGVKYSQVYDMTFIPVPGDGLSIPNALSSFDGVIEIDDISDCGFSVMYGSSSPKGTDGAIISEYAARSLLETGAVKGKDISDLIGMTLNLMSGPNFIIDGIFECGDIDDLLYGNNVDWQAFKSKLEGGWAQLYVSKGFIDSYGKNMFESGSSVQYKLKGSSASNNSSYDTRATLEFLPVGSFPEGYNVVPVEGMGVIERPGDIIVSQNVISGITSVSPSSDYVSLLREFNADPERRFTVYFDKTGGNSKIPGYATADFRIVGVIDGKEGSDGYFNDSVIFMLESERENIIDNVFYPVKLIAALDGVDAARFVDAVYDNGFGLSAEFISNYDMALTFISVLRYVLLGLSLLFCILVIVLLYGFISTSIRMTRKQIGILRALGAKKADTFKIYAVEGFIVTIFSLVLAIVAIMIGAPMLNALVGTMFGHYFSLFTIGAIVYVTMAALALAVTLVSVFIPLRKFNKITPVSAISGKD